MTATWRELDLLTVDALEREPGELGFDVAAVRVLADALLAIADPGELERALPQIPCVTLALVRSVDARVAGLEAMLEDFRPLLDELRKRVDRGASWRQRFSTGGNQ